MQKSHYRIMKFIYTKFELSFIIYYTSYTASLLPHMTEHLHFKYAILAVVIATQTLPAIYIQHA